MDWKRATNISEMGSKTLCGVWRKGRLLPVFTLAMMSLRVVKIGNRTHTDFRSVGSPLNTVDILEEEPNELPAMMSLVTRAD